MNATKEPHKVTYERPFAFNGVEMDFANAILIIARPFALSIARAIVWTPNLIIALPFVGGHLAFSARELLDITAQGFTVCVFGHS